MTVATSTLLSATRNRPGSAASCAGRYGRRAMARSDGVAHGADVGHGIGVGRRHASADVEHLDADAVLLEAPHHQAASLDRPRVHRRVGALRADVERQAVGAQPELGCHAQEAERPRRPTCRTCVTAGTGCGSPRRRAARTPPSREPPRRACGARLRSRARTATPLGDGASGCAARVSRCC